MRPDESRPGCRTIIDQGVGITTGNIERCGARGLHGGQHHG